MRLTAVRRSQAAANDTETPEQRREPDPIALIPWVIAGGLALTAVHPLSDPDVWWHLRTGEWIVAHHQLPSHDPWSYASSQPWVAHEWLSQVLMYLVYRVFDYRGAIALGALLVLTTAVLLVRACTREAGRTGAIIATLLSAITLHSYVGERPQLVSFTLLALFGPRLLRGARDDSPPLWFIPMFWIWANLHGLWSFGLLLYAATTVGVLFDHRPRGVASMRRWLLIGAGMVAAVCATPNGPRLLVTPLVVRKYAPFVVEWRPPAPLASYTLACAGLLVCVALGYACARIRPSTAELAYVIAACVGLIYSRTLVVTAILLAPLAAGAISHILSRRSPSSARRLRPVTAGAMLGILAVAAAGLLVRVPPVVAQAPYEASRTLDALPGRARVLNEYEWGGWLLWTARDTSPGLDGRTEIYSVEYVRRYLQAIKLRGDWQTFIRHQHADAAWLRRDTPLATGLRDRMHWHEVWTDGDSVILVPPSPG